MVCAHLGSYVKTIRNAVLRLFFFFVTHMLPVVFKIVALCLFVAHFFCHRGRDLCLLDGGKSIIGLTQHYKQITAGHKKPTLQFFALITSNRNFIVIKYEVMKVEFCLLDQFTRFSGGLYHIGNVET